MDDQYENCFTHLHLDPRDSAVCFYRIIFLFFALGPLSPKILFFHKGRHYHPGPQMPTHHVSFFVIS